MGDVRLPQFGDTYDRRQMGAMVDELENRLANISQVFANVKKAAYQLVGSTASNANSGGGVTDLTSYTLQPNVLQKNGYNLEIIAYGTYAANANNKQIKLLFGSSTLLDTGVFAASGGTWKITAIVTRTGAATQSAIGNVDASNNYTGATASYVVPTESLSATIIIKCTGQGVATNDIVQNGLLIRVMPQE